MKYGSRSGLVTPRSTSQSSGSSGGESRRRRRKRSHHDGRFGKRSGSAETGDESGSDDPTLVSESGGSGGVGGSSLDAVKVTVFANGAIMLGSGVLKNESLSTSTSSDIATSGSLKGTSTTVLMGRRFPVHTILYQMCKRNTFLTTKMMQDMDEGKKVPGPRDPAVKAKTRAVAEGHPMPVLASSSTTTGLDGAPSGETEVDQKQMLSNRQVGVCFQNLKDQSIDMVFVKNDSDAVVVLAVAAVAVFWKVRPE